MHGRWISPAAPMKGFVFVDPEGLAEDEELASWVALSLKFVHSLPPK